MFSEEFCVELHDNVGLPTILELEICNIIYNISKGNSLIYRLITLIHQRENSLFLSLLVWCVNLLLVWSLFTFSPSSSSSKVNNCSFHHASPSLWNQLLKELRLPADDEELSLSSDHTRHFVIPWSPLSPSSTSSLFHPRLKTRIFRKSFPP